VTFVWFVIWLFASNVGGSEPLEVRPRQRLGGDPDTPFPAPAGPVEIDGDGEYVSREHHPAHIHPRAACVVLAQQRPEALRRRGRNPGRDRGRHNMGQ
jgi:hypothetical protein